MVWSRSQLKTPIRERSFFKDFLLGQDQSILHNPLLPSDADFIRFSLKRRVYGTGSLIWERGGMFIFLLSLHHPYENTDYLHPA